MAYLAGDIDAFSVIVHNHYGSLKAQARRHLGPFGQPDDAVQETFERALKGIRRFGLTGEYRIGPWLSRILYNVCADQRTRAARDMRIVQTAAAQPSDEADVADRVSDPQIVQSLEAALRDLPRNHYRALMLHEVGGLPYADVAEAENISIENARARVSRGKSSLRRSLGDLRSSAGAILAFPAIRALTRPSQIVSKLAHRIRSAAVAPSDQVAGTGTSANFDRLAGQLVASPLGQSALALVTSAPRGALVFGLAATVATVSASTVLMNEPSSAPTAAVASGLPAPIAPITSGSQSPGATIAPALVTATAGQGSNAGTLAGWVNAGTPGGGPSAGLALAGMATTSCEPQNGISPPGSGFTFGTPLGMSNGLSVGNTPASVLPMTGTSLSFSSPLSVSLFSVDGATSSVYNLAASACLSTDGWFTASVTDQQGGTAAQLTGVLEEVLGSTGDLGYIFRGSVTDLGSSPAPLGGSQFVAQMQVFEPANTVQLTVVFLSTDVQPGSSTTSGAPSGVGAASSGAAQPSADPSAVQPIAPDTVAAFVGSRSADVTGSNGELPGMIPMESPSGQPLSDYYSGSPFSALVPSLAH